MKTNYILKYIYFTIVLKPITIILYYLVGSFFSPYVIINKKLYLLSGNRRKVYIHPNDNNKIIKISKEGYIWNNNMENFRSYLFMSKLNYISKNYGLINTNLGIGVVYELIKDYDNNISKTAHYYLQNNTYKDEIIKQLKNYYKEFYEKYDIIIHDNKRNILVKKISKEKIKLVIIDGYDTFLYSKFNFSLKYIMKDLFNWYILKPYYTINFYLEKKKYIKLDDGLFIGKGHFKCTYIHPQDSNKCIKVMIKNKASILSDDIKKEYRFFKNHTNNPKYITKFHEVVTTNKGHGLIYDLVRDYDGNISKSLSQYIKQLKNKNNKYKKEFLERLYHFNYKYIKTYCSNYGSNNNLFIKFTSKDNYEFIVIDNFTRFNHKFRNKSSIIKYLDKYMISTKKELNLTAKYIP